MWVLLLSSACLQTPLYPFIRPSGTSVPISFTCRGIYQALHTSDYFISLITTPRLGLLLHRRENQGSQRGPIILPVLWLVKRGRRGGGRLECEPRKPAHFLNLQYLIPVPPFSSGLGAFTLDTIYHLISKNHNVLLRLPFPSVLPPTVKSESIILSLSQVILV